jgi:hypothetical protein
MPTIQHISFTTVFPAIDGHARRPAKPAAALSEIVVGNFNADKA